MANQQQSQTQQISANIGQQESRNQIYAAQGAAGVQQMEQRARQTVMLGEGQRQTAENERQMNLLGLQVGRQDAEREFRGQMQAQNQAMMGGIGDIVGAGLQGFASGGGFSKDGFKMDTFLGREGGGGGLAKIGGDLLNADNVIQGPTLSGVGTTKFNDLSNLRLKRTKLKF